VTGSSAGPVGRADPDEPASPAGSGLARERTVLSWNRSGLALVVCVAVLVRHLWPFETPGEYVALAAIAAAGVVWAVGMLVLTSSAANRDGEALLSEKVFRLVTIGTLLLAGAAFVLAFLGPN
jgi:uncharacterized membrane protein YidH (DUF202 family)